MTKVVNNGAKADEEMVRLAMGGDNVTRNGLAFINNTNGRGQSHVSSHVSGKRSSHSHGDMVKSKAGQEAKGHDDVNAKIIIHDGKSR